MSTEKRKANVYNSEYWKAFLLKIIPECFFCCCHETSDPNGYHKDNVINQRKLLFFFFFLILNSLFPSRCYTRSVKHINYAMFRKYSHQIGPLGRFGLVVAMSVCMFVSCIFSPRACEVLPCFGQEEFFLSTKILLWGGIGGGGKNKMGWGRAQKNKTKLNPISPFGGASVKNIGATSTTIEFSY